MAIAVTNHAQGCVIGIRAQPGARRNAIVGEHAGMLKVAVTAAPEKGQANDAIVEVVAAALQLKRSQIILVSGTTSRAKKFLVRDVTAEWLQSKLQALVKV